MSILFKSLSLLFLVFFAFGCSRTLNDNDAVSSVAPIVPRNVLVYWAKDGAIGIDWSPNPEKNIKGFNIYRSQGDTLNLRKIAFTQNNYFIDDSLSYDVTYFYRISAVNSAGLEGRQSEWVSGRPVNYYTPYPPRYLEINARNWNDSLSIFLKWQPGSESDVAGYRIYRGTSPGFIADSSSFAGFTPYYYFSDRKDLQLYKTYFYKVQAVDKGGLVSELSADVQDMIFDKSAAVFPSDGVITDYFTEFRIKAVARPARYKIVVQTNPVFGEVWSKEISSDRTEGELQASTAGLPFSAGSQFYWRIITFSPDNGQPNSISSLFNFTIKPRS